MLNKIWVISICVLFCLFQSEEKIDNEKIVLSSKNKSLEFFWNLNVESISERIISNTIYYNENISYGPAGGPSNINPVYLALADITGDGYPEIFIGVADMFLNIQYTAYTQNLEPLPIGVNESYVPDNILFYSSRLYNVTSELDSQFLLGKVFEDPKTHQTYYLSRGWNGREGSPNETLMFTWFWQEKGEWNSKTEYLTPPSDRENDGLKDPYEEKLNKYSKPLAYAEEAIFYNQEPPLDFNSVPFSIRTCIDHYDKSVRSLS